MAADPGPMPLAFPMSRNPDVIRLRRRADNFDLRRGRRIGNNHWSWRAVRGPGRKRRFRSYGTVNRCRSDCRPLRGNIPEAVVRPRATADGQKADGRYPHRQNKGQFHASKHAGWLNAESRPANSFTDAVLLIKVRKSRPTLRKPFLLRAPTRDPDQWHRLLRPDAAWRSARRWTELPTT